MFADGYVPTAAMNQFMYVACGAGARIEVSGGFTQFTALDSLACFNADKFIDASVLPLSLL